MIQSIAFASKEISSTNKIDPKGKLNVKIYDARGYYAAFGNKLAGKGF